MNTVSRLLLPPFFAVGLSVLAQAASVPPPEIPALRVQPSGEFNFVFPNRFRSEGSVIMPAYAGLQGWDALYNLDYSSNANRVARPSTGGSTSSINSDPIGLIGDRLAAMVFLRGDVAPVKSRIGFAVQAETAFVSLQTLSQSCFHHLALYAVV